MQHQALTNPYAINSSVMTSNSESNGSSTRSNSSSNSQERVPQQKVEQLDCQVPNIIPQERVPEGWGADRLLGAEHHPPGARDEGGGADRVRGADYNGQPQHDYHNDYRPPNIAHRSPIRGGSLNNRAEEVLHCVRCGGVIDGFPVRVRDDPGGGPLHFGCLAGDVWAPFLSQGNPMPT